VARGPSCRRQRLGAQWSQSSASGIRGLYARRRTAYSCPASLGTASRQDDCHRRHLWLLNCLAEVRLARSTVSSPPANVTDVEGDGLVQTPGINAPPMYGVRLKRADRSVFPHMEFRTTYLPERSAKGVAIHVGVGSVAAKASNTARRCPAGTVLGSNTNWR
jgi:hypothetical protein